MTSSTRWRPTSPGIRTESRREITPRNRSPQNAPRFPGQGLRRRSPMPAMPDPCGPVDGAPMSRYLLNKFLFTVDRDPELVERYRDDPVDTVGWWEAERANQLLNCHSAEASTWLAFNDEE